MDLRQGLAAVGALLALALVGRWHFASRAREPVADESAQAPSSAAPGQGDASLREPEPAPRAPFAPVGPPPDAHEADPESLGSALSEEWTALQESELPPYPPESGPASLTLRLVDARDGASVASGVEPWRVDAPGNADWSPGDQLQATVDVPPDGVRLTGLPEGRYRAACASALASREPPEFELSAAHTSVALELELPREYELCVRFVDRFGEPYPSAEWWLEGARPATAATAVRSARSPRDESVVMVRATAWASRRRQSGRLDGPQPERGFALGRQHECARGQTVVHVLRLRAPDGALAELVLPQDASGDVCFVVVGVPSEVAAARVRLPDGRPSVAQVEALGLACGCTDPAREWRTASVRLRAELTGFASVDAEWRPVDGELPWILLQSAP